MLSILIIVAIGFFMLGFNNYLSNQKLNDLNKRLNYLHLSRSHADHLHSLVEENIILLIQIIFQKKMHLSGQLLAKNENILNEFEAFRNDANRGNLDDDFHFAVENEPLILSLRRDFYDIVASARKGKQQQSEDAFLFLLDHRLKPILGFLHNATILRNLRVDDAQKAISIEKRILHRNTLVIYGTILFLVLIFILVLTKSISARLTALLTTIIQISRHNDLSLRVSTESTDEIAKLGKAFNDMLIRLDNTQQHSQIINQNLEISQNNLIAEVEERKQLIQQLEDKNVELERFTYTVSHDLKSPLVTVKGFIGLLENDIASGDQQRIAKDLSFISSAADKMSILLDELLEISRVGRVVNQPEMICLTQLFTETLPLLHTQIEQSSARINIQPDMPSITADKHRMQEVVTNLLDNAIKFKAHDVAPEINVSAKVDGDFICCNVADNGIGINPRHQNKIFGLFDRLNPSYEGTGIGLALVKRIIETHDGNIIVESEGEGLGTRFSFTLPKT